MLPRSYCKLFQHRMCGVPMCNTPTAGHKLQMAVAKGCKWTQRWQVKCAFFPNTEDKNDSQKIRKRMTNWTVYCCKWHISRLTSLLLTVSSHLFKKKKTSLDTVFCEHCGPILAYKAPCLWRGTCEHFLKSTLLKKKYLNSVFLFLEVFFSQHRTACVRDSSA